MTLWAAVVAERLGYSRDEALTLGRAVAGMNAQSKAVRMGLRGSGAAAGAGAASGAKPGRGAAGEPERVELLGRMVPVVRTPQGVRAAKDGKPDSPEAVEKYLAARFGDGLAPARAAMKALAAAFPPDDLAVNAYGLYEKFRPQVPRGATGWGAQGVLDLGALAKLAPRRSQRG